ncbi:MAG: hypothetical protein IID55_12285 [Proteobacteria bacterium]|nr:hypothetical protein [Pseudomonadota bacterium]
MKVRKFGQALRRWMGALAGDRRGGVLIYTAIVTPTLLGFAGLSIDVGLWQANKRVVQAAVDAAAIAGALEVKRTNGNGLIQGAAERDAAANGFNADGGDVLIFRYPPQTGVAIGDTSAVEVIIQRSTATMFSRLFMPNAVTISARAVARFDIDDTCLWSLNPTMRGAIKIAGGAQVQLGCGILVNSSDLEALTQSGTSCLSASRLKVAGGFTGDCLNPTPLTGVNQIADPLAALPKPSYLQGACDYDAKIVVNAGETLTLSPGVYCNDISILSDGQVEFLPGVYILDRAGLNISAQATVTGNGVTFYLSENNNTSNNISIAGGASVQLSAPTEGDLAGVLFYQDRNSSSSITHNLTGGSTMDLDGILYFPNNDLTFSGGAALDASSSMLIANSVTFTGNSFVGDFDNSAAASNQYLVSTSLIE